MGESFSTGILMMSGQIFGIIYIAISSAIIDKYCPPNNKFVQATKDKSVLVFLVLAGAALIGVILTPFIKQDLKRSKNAGK